MFTGQAAELFQVSRFYNVSPTELLDWPNPLFIEAREYMEVCNEVEWCRSQVPPNDHGN